MPQTYKALDRRKATILRAVVREYVRTGQPVGSKTLVQRYRLKFSPATIRNEMAVLEELGFIKQPHTSAGRIPSDLGYRWFVDNWPGSHWPDLTEGALKSIDSVFDPEDYRGLGETLEGTSQVLSDLTEATAVAVAPPRKKNRLSRLELIRRDERKATILLVSDTGEVEQAVVEFGEDWTEDQMFEFARGLDSELHAVAFEQLPGRLRQGERVSDARKRIADQLQAVVDQRVSERVFRGGTANILSPDKFSDLATAQGVVEALEAPPLLGALVEAARSSDTVLVFIGEEVPIEQMRACAVVFAPYELSADRVGSIGVIGPTRMDYPHTISAVEAVARSLSGLLEQLGE